MDLSSYAVQYCSVTGSTWQETPLSGTLLPGHYCLVQEAQGSGGTLSLPTPQIFGTISMSSTSGKVALVKSQTLLNVSNLVGNSAVVDFVGYGAANAYEGTAAAPTLSSTTSAMRANGGGTDTNNNTSDFSASAPTPHNGSAFDAWRTRMFSATELRTSAVSGDFANPAGDGVNNLTNYAFNLDPHKTDGVTAMSWTTQFSGSGLILTFAHRKNHFATDVALSYEISTDMVHWKTAGVSTPTTTTLDAQTDRVRVTAFSTSPVLFIRVSMTH